MCIFEVLSTSLKMFYANDAIMNTVPVKTNATISKMFAPLFYKKTCCTFMVCLWICAGSAKIQNFGAFY